MFFCRSMLNRRTLSTACLVACLFSGGALNTVMATPTDLMVSQQTKTYKVTGQITDLAKEPLIGVTVTVVGTNGPIRAISDIDGIFSLNVPEGENKLEFSYVGYKKQTISVSGAKSLNVVLEEETKDIDEVVITGFSSQKKASIVGAIQTIQPNDLKFGNTRSLSNNLAGKLSGVIFPNFRIVDRLPERESWKIQGYGLDFGFTNDPTALVNCVIAHGELWTDSIIYETGLTNPKIAERAEENGITRKDLIIADSAEPKSIAELKAAGLWVVPTVKGKDSISVGIDILQRYTWNVTRRSAGMIEEMQSYKWKEDRDGKKTNTPIDSFNHAIDATRYFALMRLNVRRSGTARAHYNTLG